MEWLKANKWIVIAGVVVLLVLFGWSDGSFIPTDK
jgi:uncharacterized membrane protein